MTIKKQKVPKKMCHRKNLKLENYKHYLKAAQIENKTKHLEKNEIHINNVDSKKIHKKQY